MKAIILSAGYGTRLYPLTIDRPKTLLKINRKPIVEFILKKLEKIEEIEKTILVSNNKFYPLFEKWLKEYNSKNIELVNDLTNSEEDRLGALGDLQFVIRKNRINTDIIVIAGDNLFDFYLEDFVKKAKGKRCVSIGIYDVKDIDEARKFGVVEIDRFSYIVKFIEKPKKPFSTLIGVGVYFIPSGCISLIKEYLRRKHSQDALGHFIEYLVENKKKVFGYRFEGKWFDIGDRKSFEKAKSYFEKRG